MLATVVIWVFVAAVMNPANSIDGLTARLKNKADCMRLVESFNKGGRQENDATAPGMRDRLGATCVPLVLSIHDDGM